MALGDVMGVLQSILMSKLDRDRRNQQDEMWKKLYSSEEKPKGPEHGGNQPGTVDYDYYDRGMSLPAVADSRWRMQDRMRQQGMDRQTDEERRMRDGKAEDAHLQEMLFKLMSYKDRGGGHPS